MKENSYWKNKWKNKTLPVNGFAKRAYSIIKKRKVKSILDLGCGGGQDSVYFSNKGFNVTTVDFSESGLKNLKNLDKNIKCILSDIQKVKFKPNSFDVIYAHLSLHYFDDKGTTKIFEKLYKFLKKDGLIFIKCKSTSDPLFGKGEKIAENMYKKGHTRHFFTKEYMSKKLKSFKIVSIKKTSSIYHNNKSSFIEAVASK